LISAYAFKLKDLKTAVYEIRQAASHSLRSGSDRHRKPSTADRKSAVIDHLQAGKKKKPDLLAVFQVHL
jgi:hypothetical protein